MLVQVLLEEPYGPLSNLSRISRNGASGKAGAVHNPNFVTVLKVLHALGLKITLQPN